jgi:tetratricopeptide (TPR) repeat protein
VSQQEPPRPCTINADIPRDLETIVLKTIARNPNHRYQTAGELADDLQRFLEDRPIRARRTSAAEHAWRWCRRNPALAGVSATALILLVALAVGASIGYVQRTKALEVETQLRAQAQSERQRAEANLRLAAKAFERVFSKIGDVPQPQVFDETDDGVLYSTATPAVVSKRDAAVLQSLLGFYDQFAEQNRDNMRWLHETAGAYRRVGEIQQLLGQSDQAEEAYRRALEFYQRLKQANPEEPEYLLGLAGVHNELGRLAQATARFPEALQEHREALTLLTDHPEAPATHSLARFELARTYELLASLTMARRFGPPRPESDTQDYPNAVTCCQQALEILNELVAEGPDNGDYRFAMAQCYQHLWGASRRRGRGPRPQDPEGRSQYAEQAIGILEELRADFPDNPHYTRQLAMIFAFTNRFGAGGGQSADSISRLERGVEMMEQVVGSYPDVPEYRSTLASCCQALANSFWNTDRADEATALWQRSVEVGRSLVEEFPGVRRYRGAFSRALYSLAKVHHSRSQPEEARRLLEELIRIESPPLEDSPRDGPGGWLLSEAYSELAEVLTELGQTELAEEASGKARELGPRFRRRPGMFPFGPPGARPNRGLSPSAPAEAE